MPRTLIIDDDFDFVAQTRLVLERAGHTVAAVLSPGEAFDSIEAFHPDLVILDVMMERPDDGITIARELARRGRSFPVLMVTSIGMATGLRFDKDAEIVPVDAFLEKPVPVTTLVDAVNRLVNAEAGHAGH